MGPIGVGLDPLNKLLGLSGPWTPASSHVKRFIQWNRFWNAAPPIGQKLVHQLEVLVAQQYASLNAAVARSSNRSLNRNDLRAIPTPVFVQNQPLGSWLGVKCGDLGLGHEAQAQH